jgi:hypothetical protein
MMMMICNIKLRDTKTGAYSAVLHNYKLILPEFSTSSRRICATVRMLQETILCTIKSLYC